MQRLCSRAFLRLDSQGRYVARHVSGRRGPCLVRLTCTLQSLFLFFASRAILGRLRFILCCLHGTLLIELLLGCGSICFIFHSINAVRFVSSCHFVYMKLATAHAGAAALDMGHHVGGRPHSEYRRRRRWQPHSTCGIIKKLLNILRLLFCRRQVATSLYVPFFCRPFVITVHGWIIRAAKVVFPSTRPRSTCPFFHPPQWYVCV